MGGRLRDWNMADTRANQPAATAVDTGTLYYVTDEDALERSDGTTWDAITPLTTHAAAADPHTGYQLESEKGAASGYASLDGSTKVPFAQLPSGAAASTVAEGDHTHTTPKLDDLAAPDDNTDLDATTSAHGLLPKLPGGTTDFLRADGAYAAPPGGGSGYAPDPAAQPDGKIIKVSSGAYVFADESGGGGAVPPALKVYMYDTFK